MVSKKWISFSKFVNLLYFRVCGTWLCLNLALQAGLCLFNGRQDMGKLVIFEFSVLGLVELVCAMLGCVCLMATKGG